MPLTIMYECLSDMCCHTTVGYRGYATDIALVLVGHRRRFLDATNVIGLKRVWMFEAEIDRDGGFPTEMVRYPSFFNIGDC